MENKKWPVKLAVDFRLAFMAGAPHQEIEARLKREDPESVTLMALCAMREAASQALMGEIIRACGLAGVGGACISFAGPFPVNAAGCLGCGRFSTTRTALDNMRVMC